MKKASSSPLLQSMEGVYSPIWETLILGGLFLFGTAAQVIGLLVGQILLSLLFPTAPPAGPDTIMLLSLFSTVLLSASVLLFAILFRRRSLRSMGITKKGLPAEYGVGFAVGCLMFLLVVGVCYACGAIRWERQEVSLTLWLLYLAAFLLQGMSEELLCRGYFLPLIAQKTSVTWGILLNSLLFSLLHLGNSEVSPLAMLNIFLFGVFTSLYVVRRGNLWGACAAHSAWNFLQGNVFGIRVSGNSVAVSPLISELPDSDFLLNGGSFGAEGGLATTLILCLSILIFLFLVPQKTTD